MTNIIKRLDEAIDKVIGDVLVDLNPKDIEFYKTVLVALTFTKAMQPRPVNCPQCDGAGYDYGMDCCGDFQEIGECKSYCAVQVQVPCSACESTGYINDIPLPDQALKELEEVLK